MAVLSPDHYVTVRVGGSGGLAMRIGNGRCGTPAAGTMTKRSIVGPLERLIQNKGDTMGLDTSHDCWHGGYGRFGQWRIALAKVAGLPPLEFMEGFWRTGDDTDPFFMAGIDMSPERRIEWADGTAKHFQSLLPIRWECLKEDVLHELLNHSDCDGKLRAEICGPLADRLEALLDDMPEQWKETTTKFIAGLRDAAEAGEPVEFY